MSTGAKADFTDLAGDFGQKWNRFWFAPANPLSVCVLRILVGVLAAAHFLELGQGLNEWYASDGVAPPAAVRRLLELTNSGTEFRYSYLNGIPASGVLTVVHVLAIVASLAFAIGFLTRLSGLFTLVALLAYIHRMPQVAGHVEPVLTFLIAYLCVAPAGAWLSLDRRLFGSSKENAALRMILGAADAPVAANVALRLTQVHLAMFYAMMGLTKLYGDAWWEGTAVWILLAQTQSRPLDLTGIRRWGQIGEYVVNFWTHAIVYFELAFGILVWTRIGRPVLLWLSVAIWLSVIVATGHLLFGLTMLAANVAFLPGSVFASLVRCSESGQVAQAAAAA
jgi:uncharacterized membrane protein YphA (DoxX/SURF4 family)